MSGVTKKLMSASGGVAGGGFTAIEDVFSTYLYTGNGSTQTITNYIDLAGEGGLVWHKRRTSTGESHYLYDTERGATKDLRSNQTLAEGTATGGLTSFNSDGFTYGIFQETGQNYASWTFRKAPRFFDVVTYTGTGSARTIAHNLGTTVGSIIIKRTDTTSNWAVYHRGNTAAPETDFLSLNLTNATADDATYWNDTAPTDSVFTVGTNSAVNASGGTYVAYLFAHDPLGPSGDGSDGLIACGSYTGNGSNDGLEIDLGWEPQWVLVKGASSGAAYDWFIWDNMRGMDVNRSGPWLRANLSNAEGSSTGLAVGATSTGFNAGNDPNTNGSGETYIYIAIRRGPMRAPESGTEVFAIDTAGSSSEPRAISGFPVDMAFRTDPSQTQVRSISARLTQGQFMNTSATDAEAATTNFEFDYNNGVSSLLLSSYYYWNFRRAPEFFDVVAYTGTGSARTVSHNLGVVPEMIIVKNRSSAANWSVYLKDLPSSGILRLNQDVANQAGDGPFIFGDDSTLIAPTDSVFTVGGADGTSNTSGQNYIAYLFATLAGVSKVGSYTGNGSSQTINCGFTTGARFILIKRTDAAGDWYVWDTARGIVAGNDPHLSLNSTAAEVTTDDSIDPASSGFIVNQVAATNINVSSASYIFYAIA